MEPGVYKQMTSFFEQHHPAPPQPPLIGPDGNLIEEDNERSAQSQPSTDWTVQGPNVLRGNFETSSLQPDDPRMNVGWGVDATEQQLQQQNVRETMPWMSTTEQQPFMWSGGYVSKDDDATPRGTDHTTMYPHPNLSLPHPSLSLDFRMSVQLNPRISVGPTPFGHRNWISFIGGTWSGSWGSGIVLPGGQDSQLIIPNGSARLETNYLLQTHDTPLAHIAIKTHGWRTGPPEILAQLADPSLADQVDPNSYKFRLFIEMETGDERYSDRVNCGMWVGSGMRKGAEVVYDAYRLS